MWSSLEGNRNNTRDASRLSEPASREVSPFKQFVGWRVLSLARFIMGIEQQCHNGCCALNVNITRLAVYILHRQLNRLHKLKEYSGSGMASLSLKEMYPCGESPQPLSFD